MSEPDADVRDAAQVVHGDRCRAARLTTIRSKGRLSTATAVNAPNMMAPRITGGNVAIHGQTCPP